MTFFENLTTPAFVVDIEKVKKNCRDMKERCDQNGVQLRPHMKTHKTLEAGVFMTNGTKKCIVVSTFSEAEFFADGGFDDIILGRIISPNCLPLAAKLTERLEMFHFFIDNDVMLKALVNYPPPQGKKWSLFLKIDTGFNRAGVHYDDPYCVTLAKAIVKEPSLSFKGIYMHGGGSYESVGESQIKESSGILWSRFLETSSRLEEAGIKCPTVGVGATPSCSKPNMELAMKGINEFHPGNYVFYDYQQMMIGSCQIEDVAGKVLTRIIGSYPKRGRLLVDCGFTALSHDGLKLLPKPFCHIEGHPELQLVKMTQEVGMIEAANENEPIDFSKYPIGMILSIIPYHVCATASRHPVYYIHKDKTIIDKWVPNKGW